MEFWGRNRQYIILAFVLITLTGLLMFTARDGVDLPFAELVLSRAFAPVQRTTAAVVGFVRRSGRSLVELGTLRRDNERLRGELAELRFQQTNLVEAKLEAERLRVLLDYRLERPKLPLTTARVISRALVAWHSEVIIDRGSRHGVSVGDPVITLAGAVGRIVEVTEVTATVLLVTDPRSGMAAMVQQSRLVVMAEGDPSVLGMVRLPRLPHDFAISVGDTLITTVLGGTFPQGEVFVIGHVREIFVSADGLLKFARVAPAVDIARLEEVFVLRRGSP